MKWVRGQIAKIGSSCLEELAEVEELSSLNDHQRQLIVNAFDSEFYTRKYEDVRSSSMKPLMHFMKYGWQEKRDPSPAFSTARYLSRYPDVLKIGINPLVHWVTTGESEGRLSFPSILAEANESVLEKFEYLDEDVKL